MIYLLTYLLNLFDLVVTTHWIKKFGIEVEANPIGRFLYKTGIVYPVKIIVIGLLLLFIYIVTYSEGTMQWIGIVPFIVYSLLTIYHIYCLIKFTK